MTGRSASCRLGDGGVYQVRWTRGRQEQSPVPASTPGADGSYRNGPVTILLYRQQLQVHQDQRHAHPVVVRHHQRQLPALRAGAHHTTATSTRRQRPDDQPDPVLASGMRQPWRLVCGCAAALPAPAGERGARVPRHQWQVGISLITRRPRAHRGLRGPAGTASVQATCRSGR